MNVILEKRNDISVDAQSIKAISGTLGVNQKLIELLFLRGMKTEKDVRDFLFPDVGNFQCAQIRERVAIHFDERPHVYIQDKT